MIDHDIAAVLGLILMGVLFFKAYADVELREEAGKKRRLRVGRSYGRAAKRQIEFEAPVDSTPKRIPREKPAPPKSSPAKPSQLERDVISALVNMDYKKRDAAQAVSKARAETKGDGFETLLKVALQKV